METLRLNIGTDPEYVVIGPDNRPVPAHMVGFGDKYHKKTFGLGKAFRDGYNIEVNVPPSKKRIFLINRVRSTLKEIIKGLPKGHVLATLPAYKINLRDIEDAPPDLHTFGCDPSLNAYTGEVTICDLPALTHEERYCGAHMHFSEDGVTEKSKHWMNDTLMARRFIKMMDGYVGLVLTCMFHRPSQYRRRKYYGKAGEYRYQRYPDGTVGLEYRVPGPELWNDTAVADLAFGVGMWVWHNFKDLADAWEPKLEQDIEHAVNTGVGRMSLLRDVTGFYTAKRIRTVAKQHPFFKFDFVNQAPDLRSGWYSYLVHNPEAE